MPVEWHSIPFSEVSQHLKHLVFAFGVSPVEHGPREHRGELDSRPTFTNEQMGVFTVDRSDQNQARGTHPLRLMDRYTPNEDGVPAPRRENELST